MRSGVLLADDHVAVREGTRDLIQYERITRVAGDGEERPTEPLRERELEVLRLASKAMTNNQIAEEPCICVRTVQAHLMDIFPKLDAGSRREAMLYGLGRGWFSPARHAGLIFGIGGEAT